jgi:integrase
VEAACSKRRHRDVQPIRQDLADRLRTFLATKPVGEPVFHVTDNVAETLRKDLADARKAWLKEAQRPEDRLARERSDFLKAVDAAGHVVDFHSFRHTYVTRIVLSGANVKVAQDLARHSTPLLTLAVYTHLTLHDRTAALDRLPEIRMHEAVPPTRKATGT